MKQAIILLLAGFFACKLHAEVRLPALFSDNMVIQRDAPVQIWGWGNKDEKVEVHFRGETKQVRADKTGRWTITLKAGEYGGPYQLSVKSRDSEKIFRNVMVGDVWLCSGQSNMQMTVKESRNASTEIAQAGYPRMRLFTVKQTIAFAPEEDVEGSWMECSPETVGDFSAVAYYFGREICQNTQIPIGLISSSWGGTVAETWTSIETMEHVPHFQRAIKEMKQFHHSNPSQEELQKKGPNAYPTLLYNAMIAPVIRYPIKGTIWYQGESNDYNPALYGTLFPNLINDWRQKWGYEFPFYWVQLANFRQPDDQPAESKWAEIREIQTRTLALPHTGQAITIDIGEADDIHPRNKQDVGYRLALHALKNEYGKADMVAASPSLKNAEMKGDSIVISFHNIGTGLVSNDKYGYVRGFAIAGEDKQFVWAKAYLRDNKVVVYNETVKPPLFVRYAWSENPGELNLYSKEGLPVTPFRTDNE